MREKINRQNVIKSLEIAKSIGAEPSEDLEKILTILKDPSSKEIEVPIQSISPRSFLLDYGYGEKEYAHLVSFERFAIQFQIQECEKGFMYFASDTTYIKNTMAEGRHWEQTQNYNFYAFSYVVGFEKKS